MQVACLACAKLQGAHHDEAPGEGEPDTHHDEAADDVQGEPPWLPGRAPLAKTYLAQLLLPAQPHLHWFLNST